MSLKPKTPQQKKSESYAHDRLEGGEYPHADRKNRPLVKALGNREYRRAAKQSLQNQPEEVMQLPDERTKMKWSNSSESLPQHLKHTRFQRVSREAHNLFRKGYNARTHDRFAATIRTWMEGNTEYSTDLAEYYDGVLHGFPGELQRWPSGPVAVRRNFLKDFFEIEPELKESFEAWIRNTTKTAPLPTE